MLDNIASIIQGSVGTINLVLTMAETVSKDDPKAQNDVIQMKKDFEPLRYAFSGTTEQALNEALDKFSGISLSDNVKDKMDQNGINVNNIVTCLQAVVAVINSFKSIGSGSVKQEHENNDSKQNNNETSYTMGNERNDNIGSNFNNDNIKENAEAVQKANLEIRQEAQCNQKVDMAIRNAYHSSPNISFNDIKTSSVSPQSQLNSAKTDFNPQQEQRQARPMTQ